MPPTQCFFNVTSLTVKKMSHIGPGGAFGFLSAPSTAPSEPSPLNFQLGSPTTSFRSIKMDPEDMEKTTFITLWGTFCYKVMPFGLKNAGATYQRAMVTLFHDMMHKEIEVYVDDMIAKSKTD